MTTQLEAARAGDVTAEMKFVAERELLPVETIRAEVAAGRMVIPANTVHLKGNLEPMAIGIAAKCKINANIGNSAVTSNLAEELEKLHTAVHYGADTVMDLSTGKDIDGIRKEIIAKSPVPIGTVPIYQMLEELGGNIEDMRPQHFLDMVEHQAKQGVDYMTIHVGVLMEHLHMTVNRVTGIVSRGGSLIAKWMMAHRKQNPLYESFDDLCDIMKQYDVTWSLGDGLRPGSIADASDAAQFAELDVLGRCVTRSLEKGTQCMVEDPGHIPMHQIDMNIKKQIEVCHGAPFYVLGPLVTDIAPGYDHITSAIGRSASWLERCSHVVLCDTEGTSRLAESRRRQARRDRLQDRRSCCRLGSWPTWCSGSRDDALSKARFAFDWNEQFRLSLDPDTARAYHDETLPQDTFKSAHFCSMCGPKYCSMRITEDIRKMADEQQLVAISTDEAQ